MKKIKWIIVGVILLVAGGVCWNYIVKNERDKKYPVERYMEQEEEKQQDNTTVASNTDSGAALDSSHSFKLGSLTYEFLGYEMVEDTEIETQTRYKPEYFSDGRVPESDEIVPEVEQYDSDRMYEDYPEYYELSLHRYNYSYEDYCEKINNISKQIDYSKYSLGCVHTKTYYCFVKMRVTNESNDEIELSDHPLYLIRTNEEKSYDEYTDSIIYFDKPQHTEGEDRMHHFSWYTLQPNETLECIIGYKMLEGIDGKHPERQLMYIGTMSMERQNTWLNQAISDTVVPLYDLPKPENE